MSQSYERHFQFRPHGDRLLTSSAAFWLLSARVLVFCMAIAETAAWGYLGFLFGDGITRWLVAAFTGGIVFLIIWMIDASLITMDRAWSEHAQKILGKPASSALGRKLRETFTFGIRISLLIGSLTITAPYLAQVVFHKDIQRYIDTEAAAALDAGRKQIAAKYDSAIVAKNKEIEGKRQEYEREVAGKGTSGRYGNGPAAQAMAESVSILEEQREAMTGERDKNLADFDAAARDWDLNRDKLASSYNVTLPQSSILENRKALDALRQRPENRSTELAIKAFLGFIFAGLLLLKLFEPSSVRLYFSEVLQQEYLRYRAGTFDSSLPSTERSDCNPASMSPQRLYDFLSREWAPAQDQKIYSKTRTIAATQSLDALEGMRINIDQELKEAKAELQSVSRALDTANESLIGLRTAISAVTSDLEACRADRLEIDAPTSALDEKSRLEYRSYLDRKIAQAEQALQKLTEAVPREEEKLQNAEVALKRFEPTLQKKEAEMATTIEKIRNLRDVLSTAAGNRAASILGVGA